MRAKQYDQYLSRMSYDMDDMSFMENFHESTKYTPHSINVGLPRLIAYMTEHRAMLETANNRKSYRYSPKIALPGTVAPEALLESCLQHRHSSHFYTGQDISMESLSGILRSAIAPTRVMPMEIGGGHKLHKRPYASGGGLYPVELYAMLLHGDMESTCEIAHYNAIDHELAVISTRTKAEILAPMNDLQSRLEHASVIFVFTSMVERSAIKYGARSYRFSLIEAGEMAQNLSLCAVANGMSSLPWGGYYDDQIADLLNIDGVNETVLHVLSIGFPAQESAS